MIDKNTCGYHLSDDDLNNLVTAERTGAGECRLCGDISTASLFRYYTGGLNMLTGLTSDS